MKTEIIERRHFLRRLFGVLGVTVAGTESKAEKRRVLIQECQVAGFQFHSGDAVWSDLDVGAALSLVREQSNQHDADAVAVWFHDHQLGYIPRGDNSAVAQMLDRGESLAARITQLKVAEEPWERIRIEVSLV